MIFYKYVSAERIDILQNRLIRFTQPNALNDPFEARPNFHATIEGFAREFANTIRQNPGMWEECRRETQTSLDRQAFADRIEENPDNAAQLYRSLGWEPPLSDLLEKSYSLKDRLYKEVYNHVGILSLSETRDNLLMWAHYAEGHTGFVLMLDGSHDFFKGNNPSPEIAKGFAKPELVQYKLERPQTPIEAPPLEILLIKSSDWKHEKEWRYLKHLKDADEWCKDANNLDAGLFLLPSKCIMGVILGCYRSKELEDEIVALRRDNPELEHLQILRAPASTRRYRLGIEEIET